MSDSSSLCEDSDSSREDTLQKFSAFDEEFGLRPYISSNLKTNPQKALKKAMKMFMTKRTTTLQIQIGKYYF